MIDLDAPAVPRLFAGWRRSDALLAAVRETFAYQPGDNRATLYAFTDGELEWVAPLRELGPKLLNDLDAQLGIRFPIVSVQAYADGHAWTDWHEDSPFGAQAILSLGATRRFGIGEGEMILSHGDLLFMPEPIRHCVPVEPDVAGERCSLVFRTRR